MTQNINIRQKGYKISTVKFYLSNDRGDDYTHIRTYIYIYIYTFFTFRDQ